MTWTIKRLSNNERNAKKVFYSFFAIMIVMAQNHAIVLRKVVSIETGKAIYY